MLTGDGQTAVPGPTQAPARRYPVALLVLFIVLMAVLHVRSFSTPHREGDEQAYLAIASEMGWDFSHYTTRDHPVVSRFPYSIYRAELFHQPPLYPLVLKVGIALGAPIAVGLTFQVLSMALLLIFARRAARLLQLSEPLQAALYAAMVGGPLLLYSTTHLHHDGLLGIFLFCAFTMYIEAVEASSVRKAAIAGALFVVALNVRYNAIAALPVLVAVQALHLYRQAGLAGERPASGPARASLAAVVRDPSQWRCFAVVSLLVLSLGLPHYYRVLATYGSLIPTSFMTPASDVESWNAFLKRVHGRSGLRLSLYLAVIFPMVLTWLSPSHLRSLGAQIREGSWRSVYPTTAVFLFLVHVAVLPAVLRYYAVLTPFLLMGFILQIDAARGATRERLWKWAALTLFSMTLSGLASTIFRPAAADVLPAIFVLIPALKPLYY